MKHALEERFPSSHYKREAAWVRKNALKLTYIHFQIQNFPSLQATVLPTSHQGKASKNIWKIR